MNKTRVAINRTAMAKGRIVTAKTKVRTAMAKGRIVTAKTKVRTAMAKGRIVTAKTKVRTAMAKGRKIATPGKSLEVSNTRVITTTLTRRISTMPTKTMVRPRIKMRCCRNAPKIRTKTTNSRRPTAFKSPFLLLRLHLHLRRHSRPMRTLTSTKSNSAGSESGKSKKNSIISV
jgi:hypothetical protein